MKGQLGAEAEISSFDGWPEEDKQHGNWWRKAKPCSGESKGGLPKKSSGAELTQGHRGHLQTLDLLT